MTLFCVNLFQDKTVVFAKSCLWYFFEKSFRVPNSAVGNVALHLTITLLAN